jgi:hypothetical protein
VDKARNIFKKSENPEVLRRMVVFVDSLAIYNEVKGASEDIKEDGIKLVTVVADHIGKDVTPDDGSTVIDDQNTDVGNTTLPIDEEIHKGE